MCERHIRNPLIQLVRKPARHFFQKPVTYQRHNSKNSICSSFSNQSTFQANGSARTATHTPQHVLGTTRSSFSPAAASTAAGRTAAGKIHGSCSYTTTATRHCTYLLLLRVTSVRMRRETSEKKRRISASSASAARRGGNGGNGVTLRPSFVFLSLVFVTPQLVFVERSRTTGAPGNGAQTPANGAAPFPADEAASGPMRWWRCERKTSWRERKTAPEDEPDDAVFGCGFQWDSYSKAQDFWKKTFEKDRQRCKAELFQEWRKYG